MARPNEKSPPTAIGGAPESSAKAAAEQDSCLARARPGVIAVLEVSPDVRLQLISSRDGARLTIETHLLGSNGWRVAGASTSFAARILPQVAELLQRALVAVERRA